jgi:cytoskeletal protein RodZ
MAGAVEETAKVASGFMTAMSSNPVMLGLVVMNLAMVAMLWFVLRFAQEARKTEFDLIFSSQKEVQQILARCIVPNRTGDMPPWLPSIEPWPIQQHQEKQ